MKITLWLLAASALSAAALGAQQAPGHITGQVLTPDSQPAPGADVAIAEIGRRIRTDSLGRFTFTGMRAGTYLLEIDSPRWGRAIERVAVQPGVTTRITIKLISAQHLEEIVITAGSVQRQSETYQPASVLTGAAVRQQAAPSIGETLQGQPGVASTFNGPGASRPIIRGLSGDRVRVLEGGVGSGDASSTSPDHAVSVEPFTADRIEVIRGPATLLYGSSAIGGVVNVIDGRIPRSRPAHPLTGDVSLTGASAARERTGTARVDGGTGALAVHASGLRRVTDDYRLPGGAGALGNSALSTTRAALGASLVEPRGFFGAAGSGLNSTYGVPGGEGVTIEMEQRRLDLEGAWRFDGVLRDIKTRLGATNYEHREIEDGAVGTRFLNDSREARLELGHDAGRRVHGVLGFQLARRDFEVIGDEAFVPPTRSDQVAAFLFEEVDAGMVRLQLGGRFERQRTDERTAGTRITHDGLSVSTGLNVAVIQGLSLVGSVSRSVKLPSAEELYSDGPHLATQAYEVGDTGLGREVALNVEGGLRLQRDPVTASLAVYHTRFDDFIFQEFTGASQDGLPVLAFTQADAVFLGLEATGELELLHEGDRHVSLTGQYDRVEGTLTTGDIPLPRIPPWRVGGGLNVSRGAWHVDVGVRHTGAQERIAPDETPTAGYTMLEASAGYRFVTGRVLHEITLKGTNLADVDARSHTSFLKEEAPLPGRDITLIYRMAF